ncbi:MAG: hypothetical protein ABSF44_07815 [Candidatus Bathyarchaeia archaeon]
MNTAVLSAAGLVTSVHSLESAETSLDRAHVVVEKDTNGVQTAQEKYKEAVAKYGPNSQQAIDAADKLKAARDALSVAQQRVQDAQNNMNQTIMMSSLTIIPSVIGAFTSLSTVLTSFGLVGSASTMMTDGLSMALWTLAQFVMNGVKLNDPLSGQRVVRSEILEGWKPKSKGFDVEAEMNAIVGRKGYRIVEIPIDYRIRLGEKKLKLRHGLGIMKRILVESLKF